MTGSASQGFPYRIEPASPTAAYPDRYSIARPRIEVRLWHGERFITLLALLDSGADECLFPMEVAHFLGLPLKRDITHRYGGIGAGTVAATFGNVKLQVGRWAIPLFAGFSESPTVVPILGRTGFFSEFEVTFNRRSRTGPRLRRSSKYRVKKLEDRH